MANRSFKVVPAVSYATNGTDHYNVSLVDWFRGFGSPTKSYPITFTPDMGNTSTQFRQNVNAGSIQSTYVQNMTDDFWPQEGAFDSGFELIKPSTTAEVQFNMEISGGKGLWMPCPIYRSFSFFANRLTSFNSNWYPKSVAYKIRNMRTEEIKIVGLNWVAGALSNNSYSIYVYSSRSDANIIRNMGPEWVIYGIIINWKSNSTSGAQQPRLRFADFRMGYQHDNLVGKTRMVLPKALTWGNLTSMYNAGQRKYEPEPVPILQVSYGATTVDDSTFCPQNGDNDAQYNPWAGNCNYAVFKSILGKTLTDYIGDHSGVEIKFFVDSTDVFLYHGNVTKITRWSQTSNTAQLHLTKLDAGGQWPLDEDIRVEITGLF